MFEKQEKVKILNEMKEGLESHISRTLKENNQGLIDASLDMINTINKQIKYTVTKVYLNFE